MTDSEQTKVQTEDPVNGSFKLRIAEDKLAVYLYDLTQPLHGGEAVSIEHIQAEFKNQKITAEIDPDKISHILAADNTELTEDERCIARGTAPVDGADADFICNISERYLSEDCAVVLPDEIIASQQQATKGTPGKSVFGKDIAANNGKDIKLTTGEGISTNKTDNGNEYRATHMGIVKIEQKEDSTLIQLQSLITIADDDLQAHMDIYAQTASGKEITEEDINQELSNQGISYGIDQDIIKISLKQALNLSSNKPIACVEQVLVASGTPPVEGKDASLILSREENVVGAELSNGYIDFHELGYPWNVSKDDRVGYLREARPATEGTTIQGNTIKVNKPRDIKCKFDGVFKDEKGRLVAEKDGALIINGNSLSIVDMLVINSDVGPKTGNIHSKTPVHVKGHVDADYILESDKEVIIDKNIEDSTVRSGSSIMIKGGIRGMKSEVYSPSDVRTGFVENASIYVNGSLTVNGSIINSIVASNGHVIVGDQKVKHSMVVGGELTVHNCLEVSELGSDAYFKTVIRLGIAQEERRKIILIDKEIDEINKQLKEVELVAYRHKLTPKEDTETVLHKLAVAKRILQEKIPALEKKKNDILDQLKEKRDNQVIVKKCTYPGVIVFINDRYYKVNTKLGPGSFVFDKENDVVSFVPA